MNTEQTLPANTLVTYVPLGLPDDSEFPDRWWDVPVQRVPAEGDFIRMCDDGGCWKVVTVEFDYRSGFAFPPVVVVEIVKASE